MFYFESLEKKVLEELGKAQKSIHAAIAWINFDIYGPVFIRLLSRKVKIKIILNDDRSNHRYDQMVVKLLSLGAEIKFVNMSGIMHNKFCIIDQCLCMTGSFNWTVNANNYNAENLFITNTIPEILSCMNEFNTLWELSNFDLRMIANPKKNSGGICDKCGSRISNIAILGQDKKYTTVDIMQECCCGTKIIGHELFDLLVCENYLAFIQCNEDEIQNAFQQHDKENYNTLVAERDYRVSGYLSQFRQHRMGMPIIHAVGIRSFKWISKDEMIPVCNIIWKERGTQGFIEDYYYIN